MYLQLLQNVFVSIKRTFIHTHCGIVSEFFTLLAQSMMFFRQFLCFFRSIKVDHQIHRSAFLFPVCSALADSFYIFHLSRLNSDRLDFCKEIYIFKKDQQKNKNTPRQIAHHKKCTHQHCGCRKQNTQLCL